MDKPEKRPLKRIPLSDCTNRVGNGGRSTRSSAAKPVPGPAKSHLSNKKKPDKNSSNKSDTGSEDTRNAPNPSSLNDTVSLPSAGASTPVRASVSSSNLSSVNADDGVFEPLTVYKRRNTAAKRKGKEKAVAESLSCPPLGRKRKEPNEVGESCLSKSYTAPTRKETLRGDPKNKAENPYKKKQRVPKNELSQEFIEQQRAYFAEVDAFELPEEEVSESELE